VTLRFFFAGIAAAALVGSAAAGLTALSTTAVAGSPLMTPVVFGTPLPLDPAADLPTADQLNGELYGLADPSVPFASKSYLIEGGIGRIEARTADALMRSAVARGQVPLNFSIGAITPAAPGVASAAVTASGPGMPATTQTVTFVDQGGWKLSRSSAPTVLSIFGS
jgi:hypothetical protein